LLAHQIQQIIPDGVGIPMSTAEQFLRAVGIGFSCRFCQLPAILALDGTSQSLQRSSHTLALFKRRTMIQLEDE
jgi:hypothetical protein